MPDEETQPLLDQDIPIEDVRTDEGDREVAPLAYVISSYGADYTVDGLVKRIREGTVSVAVTSTRTLKKTF
jgi:hypothetical protein